MIRNFQIGKFRFTLIHPDELYIPANFLLFEVNEDTVKEMDSSYDTISDSASEWNPMMTYNFHFVSELPSPVGKTLVKKPDISICREGNLETRWIGVKGKKEPYACYREISDSEVEILFEQRQSFYLQVDPAFCSLFAFERRMPELDSLILHCAYMVYQGEAILFSAPSETGKTTQAELWEKYRGSRQVNGDRCLLMIDEIGVSANGWPVCGSSEICHNEQFPIRAIVMLKQAKINEVRRLRPMEAFMQIYAQITINGWNRNIVEKSSDLIEQLIQKVPVYEFSCDISEYAVTVLEDAI